MPPVRSVTINCCLAAILALFTYLADEGPALVCQVIPRRHFLRQPQRLPRPVKEDDLRAFFAVIEDTRDKAMFILMLRCGLRIGEVASLLLSDLYLDEPAPRLVVHGKGSRERSVYLSLQAEHALRRYLVERPPARPTWFSPSSCMTRVRIASSRPLRTRLALSLKGPSALSGVLQASCPAPSCRVWTRCCEPNTKLI